MEMNPQCPHTVITPSKATSIPAPTAILRKDYYSFRSGRVRVRFRSPIRKVPVALLTVNVPRKKSRRENRAEEVSTNAQPVK